RDRSSPCVVLGRPSPVTGGPLNCQGKSQPWGTKPGTIGCNVREGQGCRHVARMLLWFASPKSSVKPESVHRSRTPCPSDSIILIKLEYQRDMIKRLTPTFRHRTTLLAVSLASTLS